MAPVLKWVAGFSKKIFIIIAVYTAVVAAYIMLSAPNNIKFKTSDYEKATISPLYEQMSDPAKNKTKEQRALNDILKFIGCGAIGELCENQTGPSEKYFQQSALGGVTKYIGMSYTNPPASGIYWVSESLQNIGISPKIYAAEGIGLAGIRPFSGIWRMFRNVTYLLLTLLVVSIGIMIMLRFKINPQTVVTLENSLPRIVITILLITFSFPIAGFMIDLMYVVILAGVSIFASVDPEHFKVADLNSQYVTATFSTLWEGFFPSLGTGVGAKNPLGQFVGLADLGSSLLDVLPRVINDAVRLIGAGVISGLIIDMLARPSTGFLSPLTTMLNNLNILGTGADVAHPPMYFALLAVLLAFVLPFTLTFGGGWILAFIIWLTLLALFFRIMVMLFAAYLRILLYVIFGPFLILPTALPGKNGFSFWIRSLAGELSVFPTVIVLLLVGRLMVMAFTLDSLTAYGSSNWFDPGSTEGVWTPPFLWKIGNRSLAIIVGMQIIFLIPSIANLVRQKISGNKGLPFKTGAGVFFGGVAGLTAGGLGALGKYGSLAHGMHYVQSAPVIGKFFNKGSGASPPKAHAEDFKL